MKRLTLHLFAAAAVLLAACGPLVAPAAAQERQPPTVEVHAGTLVFADDGFPSEGFIGGAARFHVSPRLSIGPEIAYITADRHSHVMLTGNATFDLFGPANGKPPRVTPFLVAGAGMFQSRERFPREVFTHSEGAFTAGGGVRAMLGKVVSVGGEVRVGWELHLRFNALVGIRL